MRESMLGKILVLVMTIPDGWLGMLVDLLEKLNNPGAGEMAREFGKFLRKEPCWVRTEEPAEKPAPFLRSISDGKKLTIPTCSGKRTIARANTVFMGWIDPGFVNYGLDVEGIATSSTDVEVHELIRDGQFIDIYNSIGVDLDKLVVTDDQIITFVEEYEHSDWLKTDGYGTFFLKKKGTKFFVAHVGVRPGGLGVHAFRLSDDRVWRVESRRRFVIPQLTPGT